MKKVLSKGLLLCAGLLTSTGTAKPSQPVADAKDSLSPTDPRVQRLREFLIRNRSPISHLAEEFLIAADRHNLDWRLLPSISIVESGGGKRYVKNNIFGWASAQKGFASIKAGIHEVASRLSNSKLYKGKNLHSVLKTYNPNPGYPALVKSIMQRVGPSEYPQPGPENLAFAYSSSRTP